MTKKGNDAAANMASTIETFSSSDRDAILAELEKILVSSYFKNSKKYPVFLRFVVEKTLNNEIDGLKERTLGIEVFQRYSDYLPSDDPVVRITAGEVRKRLAQYYQTEDSVRTFAIHLPVGSYVPQFKKLSTTDQEASVDFVESDSVEAQLQQTTTDKLLSSNPLIPLPSLEVRTLSRFRSRYFLVWIGVLLLCAGLFAVIFGWKMVTDKRKAEGRPIDVLEAFWAPLLASPQSILIYAQEVNLPGGTLPQNIDSLNGDDHFRKTRLIPTATMTEIASASGFLMKHDKIFFVQPSSRITFYDLQATPFVVFGEIDDPWVRRLTENLRFHIVRGKGGLLTIEDKQNVHDSGWSLDTSLAYENQMEDYAILARIFDPTTNQYAVVATGLGERGLYAAGRFLRSSTYAGTLAQDASTTWPKKTNIEIVISATVLGGVIGPPRVVASYAW